MYPMTPVQKARFWSKVTKYGEEGCWIWNGATRGGYGRFRVNYKAHDAHKWTYEDKYGPIPDGYDLHHVVCETKRCVNPDHTMIIEHDRHATIHSRKLYCKRGHPLTGDNYSGKHPRCLACARLHDRNRRHSGQD
jgi:hypothetical protein